MRYSGLDVSRVVDGQLTDHWDSWEETRGQQAPPVEEGAHREKPGPTVVPSPGAQSARAASMSGTSIAVE